MFVFVEESAETIVPADAQTCDRGGTGDRLRQRIQRPGVRNTPMGTVTVVVPFVLAQGVQKMRLVPINVRSSSSWRQDWIHRSMIEFMRGIRTPLSTTVIPASARIASNGAGTSRRGHG